MNTHEDAAIERVPPDWLDWARAMRVVDDDIALLRRLLGTFLRQFERTASDLREAAARGEWATVSRTAHKLAGAAGAIGIDTLDTLARHVDRTVRQPSGQTEIDAAAVLVALEALYPLLERVQQEAAGFIAQGRDTA